MLQPHKQGREAEDFTKRQKLHISLTEAEEISRRQKLQISLNYNISQDEADRSASFHNQNPVSTGLRLSYDDDEHNSSVTSSGSMTAAPSIILSLGDSIRAELDRQKEELDQYIKIQVLASFKHIKVAVIYIIHGIHIGILVPNQFLPNLIINSCFLLGQISEL